MMKCLIFLTCFWGLSLGLFAQSVGINANGNAPDASAMLDVQATDKGMLLPRLTTAQRDAIPNPSLGLMIYNVNDSCFNYYSGSGWILDCGLRADTIKRTASVIATTGGGSVSQGGIAVDDLGNMYVGGGFEVMVAFGNTTLTSAGSIDAYVAKISRAGEVIWALHGSGQGFDIIRALAIDGAGNLFATGVGTATFGTQAVSGTFVLKISSAGQVIWGTSSSSTSNRQDISVDGTGDCYLQGEFSSTIDFGAPTSPLTSAGGLDLYLAKFNGQSGTVIWAIRDGGSNNEDFRAMATDAAGNSVVCGWIPNGGMLGSVSLGPGSYVAKYNASGQFLWAYPILGPPAIVRDLSVDPLGNILVVGEFFGSATFGSIGSTVITASGTSFDGFAAKLDGAGTLQWAFAYGGVLGDEFFNSISTDASGNSFITGYYNISAAIFGSITLPGSGPNTEDAFVLKVDPNGLVIWAQSTVGNGNSSSFEISTDAQGNAHATGIFIGTKVFGGGESFTTQGNHDMFIWSLSGQSGANLIFTEDLSTVSLRPDNLGNHTATQALNLNNNDLTNGGTLTATAFIGDGGGLTNVGDNLGNHTANQTLNLSTNNIIGGGTITANAFIGNGAGLTNLPGDNLGNHQATQNLQLGSFYLSGDGDNEGIFVDANGRVGIGTSTPTRGKVEIVGGPTNSSLTNVGFLPLSGVTSNGPTGASFQYGLYADQRIAALEVFAHSDQRIKDIRGISDAAGDLSTLMQLEITDYRLRDSITHGQRNIKKVIAQQVAEVYPQAVTADLIEVVPDIYQRAQVQDGWIMLATDLQVGERVKLITEEKNEVYEVYEVEEERFRVKGLASRFSQQSGLASQLFVYGREVDDFHTVDYEALSMLNVSATQAQQRRIEALEQENATLRAQNASFEARLQALETTQALK
ncbi:MAG: tail fiber domain-containing protein [Bacteroidota bacterium]